jgi:hypothetical protein
MIAQHLNAAMRELGLTHHPLSEEQATAALLDGLATWSMRQLADHPDQQRGETGLLYVQTAALQTNG